VETILLGNATEAAVLNAFVGRGWQVWTPFGEGSAFDLLVGRGEVLLRIQCKSGRRRKGCLVFNTHGTDHGRGATSYIGRADLFGVLLGDTGEVYLIPVSETARHEGRYRLEPTRNNQQKLIRFAEPYLFQNWDPAELIRRALAPAPDVTRLTDAA
jgi:hypothetical protein